ncbi:1-phosphatidylinositol phosphodiesterase-like protein [Hapsidospora chrysogenum ATCC 11550]|uniref:1-phosphatidylinositol phosphodiesterase-like protein n=1 Tax=Hapsidospora chrysogenum (strain ATCC 11550 / CBS 779.69 / DSM 880 / IAM 14645 / JCM 23072 / IMI 49137) TaxID=857340 RepID=A0A086T110_HAPC1|nr:1-phosphatidylinositol phosphodiesterase-like protein [Hapsidospora chrysogenum ATCC 11550]
MGAASYEKLPSLPGTLPGPRTLRPRRLPALLITALALAATLFYALLSLAPCMVGRRCYHGYSSRFSFDADEAAAQNHDGDGDNDGHHRPYSRWMSRIPDAVNLTSLSIPGTHDTMTYALTADERLQCQNANLSTQLHAGLRYFDIRARLEADELRIYHADGYTGYTFTDVLLAMFNFLDENPSEALVMRLKEEGKPIGDANTISFEEAFNSYRLSNPDTSPGAKRHLALYDREGPIPTLGALRSRIFLLQNFKSEYDTPYGLAWDGDQMVLEDLWIIPDIYHLADKWTAIRDALEDAATSPDDNSRLHLAHTSASVGVLPIEAAAGPRNRSVVGMNDMTGQWLHDVFPETGQGSRTGVVIFDFPGKKLIDAVLRWNEPLER